MLRALRHRGPDGVGGFRAPHVALGACRLSIIDVPGGGQPLSNEDGTLALVANGEIYNFIELRQELECRGHRFRTGSDCETILHLYEDHGTGCLEHLRGMFAFALWDGPRRRLMLARDRMGEKPLYLHLSPGRLTFASELRALLRCGWIDLKLDPAAVNRYFHYQYVPEPGTPVAGVRKLPAAHWLTIDAESWTVSETCYWRMLDAPPREEDPARAIRAELEELGRLVIRADVPVGIALSAGIDSSAVAALAARTYPGTLQAFSVGYPGRPATDERAEARQLAEHLRLAYHEVEISVDQVVDFFPTLVSLRDDPIADISGHGYYAVMRLARDRGVPVMMQGQGGDELFWGYPWVGRAAIETVGKAQRQARTESPAAIPAPTALATEEGNPPVAGLAQAWRWLQRRREDPPDRLRFYDMTPDYQIALREMPALYEQPFRREIAGDDPADVFTLPAPWPPVPPLMTRLICDTYLLENGIAQADRLSMASSVELRLPLVDYRLVETVIGLRKVRSDLNLPPKTWLKEAVGDLLPEWVFARPKRGFTPPVLRWHRALFATYGGLLTGGRLVEAGVLRPRKARELAEGPFPPKAIAPISFKALVLELWLRGMESAAPVLGLARTRSPAR